MHFTLIVLIDSQQKYFNLSKEKCYPTTCLGNGTNNHSTDTKWVNILMQGKGTVLPSRESHMAIGYCEIYLYFDFIILTERGLTLYSLNQFNVWTSFQVLHFTAKKKKCLNWALWGFHSDWLIRLWLGPFRMDVRSGAMVQEQLLLGLQPQSWELLWWQLPVGTHWEPSRHTACQTFVSDCAPSPAFQIPE